MPRSLAGFLLVVAVMFSGFTGFMALVTFARAQSICPLAFECEDASSASILFSALTLGGLVVVGLALRGLMPRRPKVNGR